MQIKILIIKLFGIKISELKIILFLLLICLSFIGKDKQTNKKKIFYCHWIFQGKSKKIKINHFVIYFSLWKKYLTHDKSLSQYFRQQCRVMINKLVCLTITNEQGVQSSLDALYPWLCAKRSQKTIDH